MKSILIVEDMKGVRDAMSVLLKTAGYDVTTAENGEEGYNKAITSNFDVIISDILMPVQDGSEMIMKLEESSQATPIIAMSAGGHGVDSKTALSLASKVAVSTIEKPFSKEQLLGAVESALNA